MIGVLPPGFEDLEWLRANLRVFAATFAWLCFYSDLRRAYVRRYVR